MLASCAVSRLAAVKIKNRVAPVHDAALAMVAGVTV